MTPATTLAEEAEETGSIAAKHLTCASQNELAITTLPRSHTGLRQLEAVRR